MKNIFERIDEIFAEAEANEPVETDWAAEPEQN
jgi:hypothetical protein